MRYLNFRRALICLFLTYINISAHADCDLQQASDIVIDYNDTLTEDLRSESFTVKRCAHFNYIVDKEKFAARFVEGWTYDYFEGDYFCNVIDKDGRMYRKFYNVFVKKNNCNSWKKFDFEKQVYSF